MIADPIPDDPVFLHDRQRAIVQADARRINIILALQLLEFQARMPWILPKKAIRALRVPLNFGWQLGKTAPELPGRPRLHLK